MPKLNEALKLSDADFYPLLANIRVSSVPIFNDNPSPIEKGFFPEDD